MLAVCYSSESIQQLGQNPNFYLLAYIFGPIYKVPIVVICFHDLALNIS